MYLLIYGRFFQVKGRRGGGRKKSSLSERNCHFVLDISRTNSKTSKVNQQSVLNL